jgi:signal peptidase II
MDEARPGSRFAGRIVFAATVPLAAAFDLWSKSAAFSRLGPPGAGGRLEILPGILRFETALNTGIAWSLFSEHDARWVIASLAILALPLIVACFLRSRAPAWTFTLGLAFIAGGTIGNLHDRLAYGAVRDFIHFHAIRFPLFNAADSFICVGAALLMLDQLRHRSPAQAPGAAGA